MANPASWVFRYQIEDDRVVCNAEMTLDVSALQDPGLPGKTILPAAFIDRLYKNWISGGAESTAFDRHDPRELAIQPSSSSQQRRGTLPYPWPTDDVFYLVTIKSQSMPGMDGVVRIRSLDTPILPLAGRVARDWGSRAFKMIYEVPGLFSAMEVRNLQPEDTLRSLSSVHRERHDQFI